MRNLCLTKCHTRGQAEVLARVSESHQRRVKGEEEDSESFLAQTPQHPHCIVLFAVLQGSACSFKLPCTAQGRASKQ